MKLIKKFKQATAMLLVAGMIVTGLPTGVFEAQASIMQNNAELWPATDTGGSITDFTNINPTKVNNNQTYGSSQGTAYTFGPSVYNTNSNGNNPLASPNQYSFNIGAITDPNGPKTSVQKGMSGSSRSAFSNNWWSTYYGFGRTAENDENAPTGLPVISPHSVTGGLPDHSFIKAYNTQLKGNGEVVDITIPQAYKTAAGITSSTTDKIEVRMEVKPTDDKQKLLVVWTAYNPNPYGVNFWIGAEADTMVAGTDVAPTIIDDNNTHIHMMDYFNQGGGASWGPRGSWTFSADGNTVLSSPGSQNYQALTDFDARRRSGEGRVWAGDYTDTMGIAHSNWVFAKNTQDNVLIQNTDSAAGFSANLKMGANEMKSTTFEVSMRAAVYYVDPQYTGSPKNGYIAAPLTSIQDALWAMKHSGVKKRLYLCSK